jgi:hypothetical protein
VFRRVDVSLVSSVIQWNTPSIAFYEKILEAKAMEEWLGMRLEGHGIENLKKFAIRPV